MKTFLKISLLAVAITVLTGCSAQKRAERHMRKAVALCPGMVQVKAHPIDTVLTAPGYADCATVTLADVMEGQTLYKATDHGTVVVKLQPEDSTLCVGFVAAPIPVHYQDTLSYAQVAVAEGMEPENHIGTFWKVLFGVLFGFVIGVVVLFIIALKVKIQE